MLKTALAIRGFNIRGSKMSPKTANNDGNLYSWIRVKGLNKCATSFVDDTDLEVIKFILPYFHKFLNKASNK